MQTYNGSVVLQFDSETTGNSASGALVTVRIASLPTAGQGATAIIYDINGTQIANPLTSSALGNYTFKAADGSYDLVIKEGTADEYIQSSEQLIDLNGVATPLIVNTKYNPATIQDAIDSTEWDVNGGEVFEIHNGERWETVVAGATVNVDKPDGYYIVQFSGVNTLAAVRQRAGDKYLSNTSLGFGLNFMQQLNANRRDVNLLIQGDSTGNEVTEWVYLLAEKLGDDFPSYTVNYFLWNDSLGDYYPLTIMSSGSGSNSLNIYNGSVAGSSNLYFTGARKTNCYAGKKFDLIINNYGHNQASSASLNKITYRLTESVSQLIADNPDAEIALTLQNMDTSLPDFTAKQAEATKTVADLFGLPAIDVRSVFRWKQETGVIGDWMGDVVHPNAEGQNVWFNIVYDGLKNPNKYNLTKLNSLPRQHKTPIGNVFFNDWSWSESKPLGWSLSSATTEKEVTIKETLGWSVKCAGTLGATGSIYINFNEYIQQRSDGGGVTFLARVYTPSTNATEDAGRLNITTDIGSELTSQYSEVKDSWVWRMIYADKSIMTGATTLRLDVFTGNSSDVVYIDRVMIVEGRLPASPLFQSSTLSEYYDPENVKTKATNVVTVTDDSVTMDSTSEAFPAFYIDLSGLEANEQYTMTWVYSGTGSGTILARSEQGDSGAVLETVTPLSTGTISWRATSSVGSMQISNSAGTEPFTLSDITIVKG